MTALTVYPCTLASTTLATANQLLANVTGASNTTRLTKVGTATGYGEATSQGTATAWAAGGSTGAPSGKGWLLDSTLLEGSQIVTGNWTPSCRGSVSVGSITADVIVRWYVRSSGGVYTLIGTQTLTGQAFSTTTAEYSLAAVSLAAVNFNTGDKLYFDTWLNITANSTGSSGANLQWSMASSSTQGSTQISTVTPGYFVEGSASIVANCTISEAAQVVTATATNIQANSALVETASQLVTAANSQANSVLAQNSALLIAAANTQANSLLAQSALLIASLATVQANSALAETAQIAAASAVLQANSILSEQGIIFIPIQGSVTLTDGTTNSVSIRDSAACAVTASDT